MNIKKYNHWKDFAQSIPQTQLIQDEDDEKTRVDKMHSLLIQLRHISPGTPWIGLEQSLIIEYPWLEDLHISYLGDIIALEDYNEYSYENCNY